MQLTITLDLSNLKESRKELDKADKMLRALESKSDTVAVTSCDSATSQFKMVTTSAVNQSSGVEIANAGASELKKKELNDILGTNASTVFNVLLGLIQKNGSATLKDVAEVTGFNKGSLNSHLRNGMRSIKKQGVPTPFKVTWDRNMKCAVYTR